MALEFHGVSIILILPLKTRDKNLFTYFRINGMVKYIGLIKCANYTDQWKNEHIEFET